MKLALFLKNSRLKAGLSQADVAENLGYSTPQFISNWERGMSCPPVDVIKKVAMMYGVSEQKLYKTLEEVTIEIVRSDMRKKFKISLNQKAD